jgi:serine/threonine protein kinase
LSPEIIKRQPYNYKTDIWSLGVVLYEMCALQRPFHGKLQDLSEIIVKGEYEPLRTKYSDALKNLVDGFLRVDPIQRLELHEALKKETLKVPLQRCHKALGIETPKNTEGTMPIEPTPPKSPPKATRFRRHNLRNQVKLSTQQASEEGAPGVSDVAGDLPEVHRTDRNDTVSSFCLKKNDCLSDCKCELVHSADSNADTDTGTKGDAGEMSTSSETGSPEVERSVL